MLKWCSIRQSSARTMSSSPSHPRLIPQLNLIIMETGPGRLTPWSRAILLTMRSNLRARALFWARHPPTSVRLFWYEEFFNVVNSLHVIDDELNGPLEHDISLDEIQQRLLWNQRLLKVLFQVKTNLAAATQNLIIKPIHLESQELYAKCCGEAQRLLPELKRHGFAQKPN